MTKATSVSAQSQAVQSSGHVSFWHDQHKRRILADAVTYVFLTVMAIIWLTPIVWVFMESFNKDTSPYQATFFPREYTLNNFKQLFAERDVMNFPACLRTPSSSLAALASFPSSSSCAWPSVCLVCALGGGGPL